MTTSSTSVSGVVEWLSNDPIGISGGLNQYVFCGNNPVTFRDPFGLEVNLQGHVVVWPFYHSNLRLYPDNPQTVTSQGYPLLRDANGRPYTTLGAGRQRGQVQSDPNRPRDRATYPQYPIGQVQPPPGTSNDDFITALLQADGAYPDNLDYDVFPGMFPGPGWNSNSYISGLLNSLGAIPPADLQYLFPGWNDPMPLPNMGPQQNPCP